MCVATKLFIDFIAMRELMDFRALPRETHGLQGAYASLGDQSDYGQWLPSPATMGKMCWGVYYTREFYQLFVTQLPCEYLSNSYTVFTQNRDKSSIPSMYTVIFGIPN